MFAHDHYVPILKAKAGEYRALQETEPAVKDRMTPLFEIPPIPWDWTNDAPAKTIDQHLDGIAAKVRAAWGSALPIFVDTAWIPDGEVTRDGDHPLVSVAQDCRAEGVRAIPVTGLERTAAYQEAARAVIAEDGEGVCVRIDLGSVEDPSGLAGALDDILGSLQLPKSDVDLVLDLKALTAQQVGGMSMATMSILRAIPDIDDWRTLVVAASGFPENLSGIGASSVDLLPRAEWVLWMRLWSQRSTIPRMPAFGDYAIAHPDITDVDPRIMRMSANLRYTTEDAWLVFKGRNVRDHGFEQFQDICAHLVTRPEFSGPGFSAGDAYLAACSTRSQGPGNATNWRQAGTNHHVAMVVSQIASLP